MSDSSTITAKSVAMCVLFTASMTLGTLPITLSRIFKWNSEAKDTIYIKVLLCFGGGVLLCTTFLHLLPEVSERIDELEYVPKYQIHYAELLMCIGFFTMYLVEELVHYYLHRREKKTSAASLLERTLSIRRGDSSSDVVDIAKIEASLSSLEAPITVCDQKQNHHSHLGGSAEDEEDSAVKAIRGLLVVLALSVHELFEGLAVGLEPSSKTVWYMFGAVSAHKLVIAFCIGVELVTSGMKNCLIIVYVFTFAIVSPMGIGIGILISTEDKGATDLPSVLLQGLASGTLLYVVFFEILRTERKSGLRQFLSVLVGFLTMLGITLLQS